MHTYTMWNYALNSNINIVGPITTTAKKYKHQSINLFGITFKKYQLTIFIPIILFYLMRLSPFKT